MENMNINKERIYQKLLQVDEAMRQLDQVTSENNHSQQQSMDRLRRHYRRLLLAGAYQEHSC
jgi:5-methylcytosine-specific restriction endonuclease McrBC regulatory subunit McrC